MKTRSVTLFVIGLAALGFAGWLALATPARIDAAITPGPAGTAMPFPAGFYWGAALAGHQAESQQASDWTNFEEDAVRGGRFEAGDAYGTTKAGHIRDFGHWSGTVRREKAGFDTHFPEDVAAAAAMGLNALRVSIEWARLFPRADMTEPSAEGIAYYERLFGEMRRNGITPFVTLFHYVSPAWFFEPDATGKRGWERQDALEQWGRYVRAVADHFVPAVEHWCTLNEPMVYLYNGYIDGVYPPLEHRGDAAAAADVYAALLQAHALAYRVLHETATARGARAVVGITQVAEAIEPLRNWHPADRIVARLVVQAWNWDFLDAIATGRMRIAGSDIDRPIEGLKGTEDYVGINYYTRVFIRGDLLHPTSPAVLYRDPARPEEPVNDMGWTIYPRGLYALLAEATDRYRLPIYILENGDSDARHDDVGRQNYLAAHIREMWLAIHDRRADVRGYFVWSLLDNFEWVDGFGPRLGLIAVDYEHGFRREPRVSAALYGEIAKTNALPARPTGR